MVGSTSSTSYLWRYTTENSPLPFAQVWLRPQLADLTYEAPAASGAPAQSLRPLMSSRTSTTTPWGVTGVVADGIGNTVQEQNLEVQALTPMGDTMYVGGKFVDGRGDDVKSVNPATEEPLATHWHSVCNCEPLLQGAPAPFGLAERRDWGLVRCLGCAAAFGWAQALTCQEDPHPVLAARSQA